ncbi:MAG: putative toxin-antitoxin system toxin component, PIN family [Phototrophicaceae bacterium]|jgi:putative PIN family toxin of toxin-antitoxin system
MTNRKRRFVLDTNLVVSAFLRKNSSSRQAFDLAQRLGVILLSASIVNELEDVLQRKKFDKYISLDERLDLLAVFIAQAEIIAVSLSINACRDPKDNKFLELAVEGKADSIISGDEDLLVLHPFSGIQILTPRQFIDRDQAP